MCEQPRCTRIELVHQDRTCQRIRSLRWIGLTYGCGGGEASQVYMCDTPLTHWRGGGFMRHVSSSFIEFIKTLVGLHRTVPSPYSQPILTPGWHFNASQNEGSQYASEVVTTCPNLFLRLGRQGEHVLFGESVLVEKSTSWRIPHPDNLSG